jgi:hypothetical protein
MKNVDWGVVLRLLKATRIADTVYLSTHHAAMLSPYWEDVLKKENKD